MKIIDLHTHCNNGSKFDSPSKTVHNNSLAFIKQAYNDYHISCGGFTYFSTVLSDKEVYDGNEQLFNVVQKDKKMFQWLVLDPRNPKLFDQIAEKITNKKVLGIKIHSVCHGYDIEEYGDKIFSFANDLKCFVLMHPDKIGKMTYFANKYKDMNLIIAHIREKANIEVMKSAKFGNVFTDTSGSGAIQNNIIEEAIKEVGSEKIFFGTDNHSCAYEIGRISLAKINKKDKENIFYKNALNFFPQLKCK